MAMNMKNLLQKVDLTSPKLLQTLVENRRVFNLNNCELNIYESYQQAYQVPLTFNDFVITSMIRGKKVMHLEGKPSFDYLPGETVIVPANETMAIDFPEAEVENPTQCIALAVDANYIYHTLEYLNNFYNAEDEQHNWVLQFNKYHFENDTEVSALINKLIRICSSGSTDKNIFADLNLKELLIRLLQSQHLQQIAQEISAAGNQSRHHFVLSYIQEHLTEKIAVDALSRQAYLSRTLFFKWFREQFGLTPLEYINRERVNRAKKMLADGKLSVNRVSAECGFTDANYFIRTFKKMEGITPKAYQTIVAK
jgi:AraC-like DNA-binding protein